MADLIKKQLIKFTLPSLFCPCRHYLCLKLFELCFIVMAPEKEVLEDVGAGKGHLSTVQLIYEEKYGGNVILKVPGAEISKKILSISNERFEQLHNTEVDVYSILNRHPKNIKYPKIYHMEKMNIHSQPVVEGCIVMEYIPRATHLFIERNLKPEELVEPVRNIARLHSLYEDLTDEERVTVTTNFLKDWFSELCTDKVKLILS